MNLTRSCPAPRGRTDYQGREQAGNESENLSRFASLSGTLLEEQSVIGSQ
jgi:hypothetical protein